MNPAMSSRDRRIDELEQLLRDERARRAAAERRASDQADKAVTWRERAEERADRIERLLAERRPRRRRRSRGGTPIPVATSRRATSGEAVPTRTSFSLPSISVATATRTPGIEATLDALAPTPLGEDRNTLASADLVVVEPAALATLPTDLVTALREWAALPARQPLVVWYGDGPDTADSDLLASADLVLTIDPGGAAPDGDHTPSFLAASFDRARHNPIGRRFDAGGEREEVARDGVRLLNGSAGPIAVIEAEACLDTPPPWLVTMAASGIPVCPGALDAAPDALARAGTAARRWAYREHAPEVRARHLLDLAGVAAPDPRPAVAAVLITMRPHRLEQALIGVLGQTYRPVEVVIGLHGADNGAATEAARVIDRLAVESIPVTLLRFSEERSLGECLNNAIATTGAEIIAKIDDDDVYGAAHLEDGVHALGYSGAGVVGKGAQFTYVESEDVTVLRRAREEESFLGGSVTGASMLIRRAIWEQVRFPHRPRQVDTLFGRGVRRAGERIYANSRWEFCYVRLAGGHTWSTGPESFLSGADVQWSGLVPSRVAVPDLRPPGDGR